MNFLFISPMFPKNYWLFCKTLKEHNVKVLAIGDTPEHTLSKELRNVIDEYCYVNNMDNYDNSYKAVAYLSFKYGKIDFIASVNEYWLELEAHLRTDFNINSGMDYQTLLTLKSKSKMKAFYQKANVKTARYHLLDNIENALKFTKEVGYPIIAKPDIGVGAYGTFKINNDQELQSLHNKNLNTQYILEEFVEGDLVSFDGLVDYDKNIIFKTSHIFPIQVMNAVNNKTDFYYYNARVIPDELEKVGTAVVEAFPLKAQFFHMEFFKLTKDTNLGQKGEYIGLEVNLRAPGGYTLDMDNYANNIDIYDIYADMVLKNKINYVTSRPYHCVYYGRRFNNNYRYSNDQIANMFKSHILVNEEMPQILAGAMGDYNITARFTTMDEVNKFIEMNGKQDV